MILRPKDSQDNATPSENSLAADGLLRLAALTGDADAAARAERWVATLAPVAGEYPTAFAFLLEAIGRLVRPPLEVAVVGEPDDPARGALVDVLRGRLLPASVRVTAAPGTGAQLTPLLAERAERDGRAPGTCASGCLSPPVTDADALRFQLDDVPRPGADVRRVMRRAGAVRGAPGRPVHHARHRGASMATTSIAHRRLGAGVGVGRRPRVHGHVGDVIADDDEPRHHPAI